MIRQSSWFRARRRSRTRHPRALRPGVDALEGRITPTSVGWAIDADPNLNGVTNWGQALDSNNETILTGDFTGTTQFGSILLNSAGGADAFVAKLGSDGSVLWAKRFGGSGGDSATRVATDASGNIYMSGSFSTTVSFGPFTLTSTGDSDAFVAKLDSAGNVLWVSKFGGTSADRAWDVALDSSGNVYTTGYFSGAASFGSNITLTSAGVRDIFVAKLDPAGNTLWVRRMGGPNTDTSIDEMGVGIATDPTGNVYVTGKFSGTADFGATMLTSKSPITDGFVTELDASGNFQWAQRMGGDGNGDQGGLGLAIDSRSAGPGNWAVYVTGFMSGNSCDFGSTTFATAASGGAFVTKLNAATGSFTWADQLGGAGQDIGLAIALDGSGNVYTAGKFGSYNQSGNFDPHGTFIMYPGNGTFTGSGNPPQSYNQEGYVSMLDPNGNFLAAWQTTSTGPHGNTGYGIAADAAGDIWVSGQFGDPTIFPTGQTLAPNPAGAQAIYLMKLNAPLGAAVGTVWNDINKNGVRDAEPGLGNWTVFADLNNNGVADPGEPSAVTDMHGRYEILGLASGTYTIRPVVPSGWTNSAPAGGASTVTVSSGFVRNDFGEYRPTTQTTYTQSKWTTIQRLNNVQSKVSVSDSYSVLDVDVNLTISFYADNRIAVYLIAPDGTTVPLTIYYGGIGANFTNTTFDDEASTPVAVGTAPFTGNYQAQFPLAVFQGKSVMGTWTLQVDNSSKTDGKLNGWSLIVTHATTGLQPAPAAPVKATSPARTSGGLINPNLLSVPPFGASSAGTTLSTFQGAAGTTVLDPIQVTFPVWPSSLTIPEPLPVGSPDPQGSLVPGFSATGLRTRWNRRFQTN